MSEEQKIILEVSNVCKKIKGREILKDISFSLKKWQKNQMKMYILLCKFYYWLL